MTDGWKLDDNTDLLKQQVEFVASSDGACQLCLVNLAETDGGVVVSAGNHRMNLMLCRRCAAGTALSILLALSNEEVARIMQKWILTDRNSISTTVSRLSID